MIVELTDEEAKLLNQLLELDLEKIGFEDDEVEILENILAKINKH